MKKTVQNPIKRRIVEENEAGNGLQIQYNKLGNKPNKRGILELATRLLVGVLRMPFSSMEHPALNEFMAEVLRMHGVEVENGETIMHTRNTYVRKVKELAMQIKSRTDRIIIEAISNGKSRLTMIIDDGKLANGDRKIDDQCC